ncbi:MAG: VCBS repeat-containing protein [Planctomycetota bacterium]
MTRRYHPGDLTKARNYCFALVALTLLSAGCDNDDIPVPSFEEEIRNEVSRPADDVAITTFCGGCHVFPPPSSFPRERWRHEVEQGFEIYNVSGRSDLKRTDVEATVAWFESYAPDRYEFPSAEGDDDTLFEEVSLRIRADAPVQKIAHVRHLDGNELLLSGVQSGNLFRASLSSNSLRLKTITSVADPVHAEPTDLDGDGKTDYVVADIGTLNPKDQWYGTLWWVHPSESGSGWQHSPIMTGLSRVCDARPIDYDQDGDQDLIVAEFGYRFEGAVYLVTNEGLENGVPKWTPRVVDERNGAIHVPVIDFNQDDRPDFLTLVSQEHEAIELHLNLGDGKFQRHVVYTAGDPAYASSGIQPVDMDGDGDLDVLYTNGDTFDDHVAKPFHGVQWLENEGTFPFTHHHVTAMPGAYRAVAGDIDLDGDMDIAAVSTAENEQPSFDGIIWLEQTDDGTFARHRILAGQCQWASCVLADVDGDDDLDLVTGRLLNDGQSNAVAIYRNKTNP